MTDPTPNPPSSEPRWLTPLVGVMAVMALAVALVGLVVAGGDDSSAATAGGGGGSSGPIEVSLTEFAVSPAALTVDAGATVTLVVTNDGTMPHDLKLNGETGTVMLDPGASETVELGPIEASSEAWCTVPGHKDAGMVMAIEVAGDAGSGDHGGGNTDVAASPGIDLSLDPPADFASKDPTLAPAPAETVHEVTLRATEEELEIAPGVTQMMWTFGGEVPGPVLHGKVGDTFEVTLINDGQAGHSIDFHASQTPMDTDMRTIEAGESLVYTFKAEHSGIWMYHCGTAPVLHHIGNGMYGAVIIDPPNLAPVDKEYAFVQSELYAGTATEPGSLDAMLGEQWDAVAFNGVANQYVHQPITSALPGERIRVWVLDAGPSENSAFHIVGTQWDTVFKEGAYLLRPDNPEVGGSQTMDLQPSQGGFVEFTFPADGTYAMVTHKFATASKGALGLWKVGDVPESGTAGH